MKLSREDLHERFVPIMLSQGIGLACGLAGVRLASHWIPPDVYGRYGIFLSLAPVGMWVIFAGLIKFTARHWAAAEQPQLLRELLRAAGRKTPWLILAVAGLTLLVQPANSLLFGGCLLLASLLLSLAYFAHTALQAARRHWADCGLSTAGSVTRAFLPLLLYAWVSAGLFSLLGGFVIHGLVVAAFGCWWLRSAWRRPVATGPAQLDATYAGPLFVTLALAGWTLGGINRWVVVWLYGAEAAGYFTLAGNIAIILPSMIGSVMLQFFQPVWFAPRNNPVADWSSLLRQVDRVAVLYCGLALGACVVLHVLMPHLVGPLISDRYQEAVQLVLPAGFFTTAVTIGYFYHTLLLAARQERACAVADLGGAGCLVAGSLVSALLGWEWFVRWLVFTPLIPWLVNRPLARWLLFRAA